MGFTSDEITLIDQTQEVEIETTASDGATHRTIIWAVIDGVDAFIRSYIGPDARWYREALADPSVALQLDGRRLSVTAILVTDSDQIARASAGFARKYAGDPATPRLNRPEVLDLTLRLDRADERTPALR